MNLLLVSSLVLVLAGADVPPATVQAIAAAYEGPVAEVFGKHCADCHGQAQAGLAEPARKAAAKNSRRAHRKLNMDEGFPFRSKWDLPKLMGEIGKSVADADMPPAKYQKTKGTALSEAERQAIVQWARDAEALLKQVTGSTP